MLHILFAIQALSLLAAKPRQAPNCAHRFSLRNFESSKNSANLRHRATHKLCFKEEGAVSANRILPHENMCVLQECNFMQFCAQSFEAVMPLACCQMKRHFVHCHFRDEKDQICRGFQLFTFMCASRGCKINVRHNIECVWAWGENKQCAYYRNEMSKTEWVKSCIRRIRTSLRFVLDAAALRLY